MDQSNLIEAFNSERFTEFVVKQGNGVKGVSELNLPTIPEQYIQPLCERIRTTKDVGHTDHSNYNKGYVIPIIDLSRLADNDTAAEVERSICAVAESYGFFQVVNHGIPLEVLETVKESTRQFFGLPAEEKRKYLKENSPSSHVRLNTSFIPEVDSALEWKDYLSLFHVNDLEAQALWPPVCRDQLLDYMKRCEVLIKPLVEILMKGLDIQQVDQSKYSLLTGSKRINLNYYPKCPNPDLTVGVGRHSDVSTFTILLQDHVGGLYVRSPDLNQENWIHVPPIEGALVINIGDALQILSNGRYKSIEHRVAANGEEDRISIPLFVNPKPTDMIGPMEEVLVRTREKPKYKNVVYSEYVLYFYKKAHRGKDTLDFAKI